MKVSVLSLNPGIDRVMYLPTPMNPGHMNRLTHTVTSQGSKGANCAILLHRLGCRVEYFSFTGGIYGGVCNSFTDGEGISSVYVEAACGTRVNTKLIDGNGVCSEFNEPGGPFSEDEIKALTDAFLSSDADVYVMTGSLPSGADPFLYARLTSELKKKGAAVVLDCAGDALKNALPSGPDLIKPNADELDRLCADLGVSPDGSIAEKAAAVIEKSRGGNGSPAGIRTMIVTDGGNGSYLFTDGIADFCPPSDVIAEGFSGAGDCFLCGFVYAKYSEGTDDREAHLFASCCGGAKVTLGGTLIPSPDCIYRLFNLRKANL